MSPIPDLGWLSAACSTHKAGEASIHGMEHWRRATALLRNDFRAKSGLLMKKMCKKLKLQKTRCLDVEM